MSGAPDHWNQHAPQEPALDLRSNLAGCAWPAIPSSRGALLQAMLFQFAASERWSADEILAHQLEQLQGLLRHAYESVEWYRRRLHEAGYRPGERLTLAGWRALPLLSRRDVQGAAGALASRALPPAFGGTTAVQTSGSTGEPVKVLVTAVDQLLWDAITLREHAWHRRDLTARLASIRVFLKGGGEPPHGTRADNWGGPAAELYATGPMALLSLTTDVAVQARWLQQQNPEYLLTYPTNLAALMAHFAARRERLGRLRAVRTVGETVTPQLRAACREAWGVPLVDLYSSQEAGYLALQCPQAEHYHVMAESVLVEILDANGAPCAPGETGRIVVTKLHSFAMPLIRYEIGDYAQAGPPCPCGRGLPTIARILGRSRNMLSLPGSERHWPVVGFSEFRAIAPVRQYQLVQHTLQDIEVRFAVERTISADEEERLARVIRAALGHPFRLRFTYFDDAIPRGPGGKFEEFVSRLAA